MLKGFIFEERKCYKRDLLRNKKIFLYMFLYKLYLCVYIKSVIVFIFFIIQYFHLLLHEI